MKRNPLYALILIYGLIIIGGTSGCYYDNEEELYPATDSVVTATFKADIAPMIQQNCATSGCHAGGQTPILTSYAQISANKDRIKARAVDGVSAPMPPTGLMQKANRDKLGSWIAAGAPDN